MARRRTCQEEEPGLSPVAEATQFILSGGDKPCLMVQYPLDITIYTILL